LASPRTLTRTPTRTPTRTLLLLGLATAATLSVLPAGTSAAEPRPSLREVQQRVDALNAKVDAVNEQYVESKIALASAARTAAVAKSRVAAAQRQLDVVKSAMSSVVAAAYRSGGAGAFVQLVNTSTPQTFLDRASSLNRIAAGQSAQLAGAATARHRLDSASKDANDAQAAQASIARDMSDQKATIEGALADQETLLGSLKADERRQYLAAQASRIAASSRLARASRSRVIETYNGPASGRAGIAVQEAYNKLGSPYQWAASGPDRFDCSGLTMWVWGKAGVSLSHSSQSQFGEGQHVSQADLQPGDLTFYGSPIHHVGIYVGGGRMISAPHTGDVVKLQDAFRSDYVGAIRP
jgi:cell wall-associated NlpC family hydrolase